MKKFATAGGLWMMVLVLSGCGGGGDREALMKDAISAMDEMATAMESSANAQEAKPKLEGALAKLKDVKTREEKMGRPTKSEEQSLKTKFQGDLNRIQERMKTASMSLAQKDPTGFPNLLPIFTEMASWGKK